MSDPFTSEERALQAVEWLEIQRIATVLTETRFLDGHVSLGWHESERVACRLVREAPPTDPVGVRGALQRALSLIDQGIADDAACSEPICCTAAAAQDARDLILVALGMLGNG